jgi:purine-nucleoside phosphorylase
VNGIIDQNHVDEAVRFIQSVVSVQPRIALILGSGLGDFAENLKITHSLSSSAIPHYPRSTVEGHAGKLVFGSIIVDKKQTPPLLVFQGRIHYYETAALEPVLFPVYLAAGLGTKKLIVTNAAGGISRKFRAGDLMLIRDLLGLSFLLLSINGKDANQTMSKLDWPLKQRNTAAQYFDVRLQKVIRDSAKKARIALQEGTYCWLKGPTYETAAEIEMLRRIGADAVGMSTVPEIVAARTLGMKVAGISLISNLATGITGQKLSHTEVTETAARVKKRFSDLMKNILLDV